MKLAELSIQKSTVTWTLAVFTLIAGFASFNTLPRLEDPEFTIKNAVIMTSYPGATAREVEEEVTDLIERAAQELGQLWWIESTSTRGMSSVKVRIKDKYDKDALPQVWDELRRKITDVQGKLPPGAGPSVVNDDFGDVYGVYAVLYGDDFSYAELKETAKLVRRELLTLGDVKKIVLWGDQQEVVYVEMSREKMANLGISQQKIYNALQAKNVPADAGKMEIGEDYIAIHPTGEYESEQQFGDLLIGSGENGSLVYLRDVATVTRGYQDPPARLMRFDGKPGVALGISTVQGGNVVRMGEQMEERIALLKDQIPLGMDAGIVSLQSAAVTKSVSGFMVNLVEAVLIVFVVLMIFMGARSGAIIGGILVLTIAGTFVVMGIKQITLERISLGALIIALGMLVDNAIVIIDGMKVRIEGGMDRTQAASEVCKSNSMPLLGATVIAVLAFASIGTSEDGTGEYCRTLFQVILISLMFSWVTAMTVTPLVGKMFLAGKKKAKKGEKEVAAKDPYAGGLFLMYRNFLMRCIRFRWVTMGVVLGIFVVSLIGFTKVDSMFFPGSTRPQMYIDVWFPEGTHIETTAAELAKAEQHLLGMEGVTHVSTAIGGGDLRFLLTYDPNAGSSSLGVLFVDVEDYNFIPTLLPKAQKELTELLPNAVVNSKPFRLGPGEGGRIQLRVSGDDPDVVRQMGEMAGSIFREERAQGVRSDWRNKVPVVTPVLNEQEMRRLGLDRPDVTQALQASFSGTRTGSYRERDELLPIVARSPEIERLDVDSINDLVIWSPVANRMIPLRQLVTGFDTVYEDPIIWRRDRKTTFRIHGDPSWGVLPSDLISRIKPRVEMALGADVDAYYGRAPSEDPYEGYTATTIPVKSADWIPISGMPGYSMAWGGEAEDSARAQGALAGSIPIFVLMMILIVVLLFNSIKKTLIIWLTVPLAVIGVAWGLLGFGQPFGFMALLGFLSLMGMLIKNSIVLIDEIQSQQDGGNSPFWSVVDAGVSRMRPVAMAAATTILGMIPLLTDAFFVAMAVTIMAGLLVATVLTLVVVPVLTAIFFRIPYEADRKA